MCHTFSIVTTGTQTELSSVNTCTSYDQDKEYQSEALVQHACPLEACTEVSDSQNYRVVMYSIVPHKHAVL